MNKKCPNQTPTIKQYRYAKQISEDTSNTKREAMLKAGYAPTTAVKPCQVERSVGWKGIGDYFQIKFPKEVIEEKIMNGLNDPKDKRVVLEYMKFLMTIGGVLKGRTDIPDQQVTEINVKWAE